MSDDFHAGWRAVELGSVTTKIGSGATPKGGAEAYHPTGIPLIRSMNVHFRGFVKDGLAFLNEAQATALSGATVAEGDVLLNITGASIGRVTLVPEDMDGARVNQHVCIIRPNATLDAQFLARYFASPAVQSWVNDENYGVTRQALTKEMLLKFIVPLPPLAEQRRIVARIEALFARTRRARADLERTVALARAYRRAAFRTAFNGESLGLPTAPTELPQEGTWDLPSGWRWSSFRDAADIASNLVSPSEIPDLLHLAPDNIESGTAKLLPCKTIREAEVISAKHRFFSGQIIYSKIRPYLRKAVLVDFDGGCSADMYPLNVKGEVDRHYLLYWVISEDFAAFTSNHEGRTVLPKINQQGLNSTPVPLPPLKVQQEIGSHLAKVMARTERVTTDATRAFALLDRLEQSILARAFRGELVPQDLADEPAEIALARVKVLAPTAGTKPGRRRGEQSSPVIRIPKARGKSMLKSRADADVKGKSYLADRLRRIGPATTADDLYREANLPIADFYKQLSYEMAQGWIRDAGGKLEAD